MSDEALLNEDDRPLSPWWIRAIVIVMALGFAGLGAVTFLAYRHAPPIPARVVDAKGARVSVQVPIQVPGATTSGFNLPSSHGPRLEKSAIASCPSV